MSARAISRLEWYVAQRMGVDPSSACSLTVACLAISARTAGRSPLSAAATSEFSPAACPRREGRTARSDNADISSHLEVRLVRIFPPPLQKTQRADDQ